MAENAVKKGAVISEADSFCNYFRMAECKMEFIRVTAARVTECRDIIGSWKITPVDGLMSAHAMVVIGRQLWMRETSCFKDCCFKDDQFSATCPGWIQTKVSVTATGHQATTANNDDTPAESLSCDDHENGDDEVPLIMPSPGDYIAIVYRKKWYVSKVIKKEDDEFFITSLTPTRGKWRRGKTDEMYIGKEDILCKVSEPEYVNKPFMDISPSDRAKVERAFERFSVV